MKFSFVKNRKVFFAIALVMVVATLVSVFAVGFNLDIEFVGGTELTFDLDKKVEKADEDQIEKLVVDIVGNENYSSLRVVGDNKDQVVVRTKIVDTETDYAALGASIDEAVKALYPEASVVSSAENKVVYSIPVAAAEEAVEETEETAEEAAEETEETAEEAEAEEETVDATAIRSAVAELVYSCDVEENEEGNFVITYEPNSEVSVLRGKIADGVNELYPLPEGSEETTRLDSTNTVSAEVSTTLKKSAITATLVAILLMLVYIAIRFEGRASLAAVVCLAHDVIVMLLAYIVFQIPVGSTIIAAILTILGYSINATIVVFDRVRENIKSKPGAGFEENVDSAVKSTLWRSLNTTITTLLTIGLIYIMGVTSIKNFALPIIIGIVSGAFSSICLSGNIWYVLKTAGKKNK